MKKYLFVVICAFFLFTRFYKISEIPPSVYWDEASIGYNAYSIAQTGKDEWGKSFPIHFRAFGEFKLPVYIYATALSVKLFGLNEFSVRFPAVMFSLGIVILTYLLTKKFSNDTTVGLLSSFFMVVTPWFFIFSRTGYEATAGLMFYLLAVFFFLEYNKNRWFIFFSFLSFIFSAYSYNSFRVIAPLAIIILIFYEIRNFKKGLSKVILPLILSSIFLAVSVIPIYRLYTLDAGSSRMQVVAAQKKEFIKNYLSHFSPDFLIFKGDANLRSQQTGFGQIYLPELILLLLGFLSIISKKQKEGVLLIILAFIGPIPAAITKESPHALRAISTVPFLCIIAALGIIYLKKIIRVKYLVEAVTVLIFLVFFINYFVNFLEVFPVQSAKDWQYAYKRVFTDYKNDFLKYDKILVSDEYAQPYIFALFYQKIDPNEFRQTVKRNDVSNWGFSTVSSFGKFKFGKIDKLLGSNLIFASNEEKAANLAAKGKIKFLNGTTAFWVYAQ